MHRGGVEAESVVYGALIKTVTRTPLDRSAFTPAEPQPPRIG